MTITHDAIDLTTQGPLYREPHPSSVPLTSPYRVPSLCPTTPRHVQTYSLWSTNGWQADGWHPTGMLYLSFKLKTGEI